MGLSATAFAWSRRRGSFGGSVLNAETRQAIEDEIAIATETYYLPEGLVRAMCMQESGCRPVSGVGLAGEIGIMQVTPGAMADMGFFISTDSGIPDQIAAGAKWLRFLADRWLTEVAGPFEFVTDWDFVIRAYNAGFDGASRGRGDTYLNSVLTYWTDRPYFT